MREDGKEVKGEVKEVEGGGDEREGERKLGKEEGT